MLDLAIQATAEDEARYAEMRTILEKRAPGPAANELAVLNDVANAVQTLIGIVEESKCQQTTTPTDGSEPVTTYAITPAMARRMISVQWTLINALVGHTEAHAAIAGISYADPQYQIVEAIMHQHNMQAFYIVQG